MNTNNKTTRELAIEWWCRLTYQEQYVACDAKGIRPTNLTIEMLYLSEMNKQDEERKEAVEKIRFLEVEALQELHKRNKELHKSNKDLLEALEALQALHKIVMLSDDRKIFDNGVNAEIIAKVKKVLYALGK